jgi:hypothetical protein
MLRNLGRLAVDRRLLSVVARTLLTGSLVIGLDAVLKRSFTIHPWVRIGADAAAYVVIALATRSVRIAEARAFVQLARAQKGAATA